MIRVSGEQPDGVQFEAAPGRTNAYYSTDPLGTLARTYTFEDGKAEQLAIEPVLDLPRGHELAVPARERGCVDAEDHRHRGLVDRERRDGRRLLGVGNRLADVDVLDAGEADDVARGRGGRLDTLQSLERVQLRHGRSADGAVELADGNRVADLDRALEHAADGEPAEVVARVEVGDESLQRVAAQTGGTYHEAVTTDELRQVYSKISSSVGYRMELRDISARVVGYGLIIALLLAAASLAWFSRLP